MRWDRFRVPFPMMRGVKIAEEAPLAAVGLADMPFPGRTACSADIEGGLRRMDPIVKRSDGEMEEN